MASVKAGAGSAGAGAIVCVRTPEDRFRDLEGYPFAPHYARVWPGMLSVHYVDEGPRDREPILLMHGEPSWSYLYRHMIKELVALGHRVVAPDLVGFGKYAQKKKRLGRPWAGWEARRAKGVRGEVTGEGGGRGEERGRREGRGNENARRRGQTNGKDLAVLACAKAGGEGRREG